MSTILFKIKNILILNIYIKFMNIKIPNFKTKIFVNIFFFFLLWILFTKKVIKSNFKYF